MLKVDRHSSNSLLPNSIYLAVQQKLDTINVFAIVVIGVIPKGMSDCTIYSKVICTLIIDVPQIVQNKLYTHEKYM